MIYKGFYFTRLYLNKLFDKPYICDPSQVELVDDFVKDVLHWLKKDFLLILVTNQTWVWAGFYTYEDVLKVNKKLEELLGLKFDWVYMCCHHPNFNCNCRKPKTGLFEQAIKDFNIDVAKSWMIGDKQKDMIAGKKVWLKTILLWDKLYPETDFVCRNYEEVGEVFENLRCKDNT